MKFGWIALEQKLTVEIIENNDLGLDWMRWDLMNWAQELRCPEAWANFNEMTTNGTFPVKISK